MPARARGAASAQPAIVTGLGAPAAAFRVAVIAIGLWVAAVAGIRDEAGGGRSSNASAATQPFLAWVGPAVVRPGQTLMASGSGFTQPCYAVVELMPVATLREGGSDGRRQTADTQQPHHTVHTIAPTHVSVDGIMATVPTTLPMAAYAVRAVCSGTAARSNSVLINVPRVWWAQGTCGNETVPRGTLRLFGAGLAVGVPQQASRNGDFSQRAPRAADEDALIANLSRALKARDFATVAEIAAAAHEALGNGAASPRTQVRLESTATGKVFTIQADAAKLSEHHAEFTLPDTMPPGDYLVAASNGLGDDAGWINMSFFESPEKPVVATVTVKPLPPRSVRADPRAFSDKDTVCRAVTSSVFDVSRYGPTGPLPSSTYHTDATDAVQHALQLAAAAGGGTVYFSRGQYWIRGSFNIPSNVYLKGEGTSLVSLFWAEANFTHHPQFLFSGNAGTDASGLPLPVTWGLADLTIYATAYYRNFIIDGPTACNNLAPPWNCTSYADGFTMQRVRVRANAYFGSSGPFTTSGRPRPNVDFNFSIADLHEIITLNGRNWRVEDCDLLGTGGIFSSGGSGNGRDKAAWGVIARNTCRNGGNSLMMDQFKQVIVEDNAFGGASLVAMGNAIATYNGGYAHHIAMINNSITHVYGDDREVLTYDNAGGAYFGPLAAVAGNNVTTLTDRIAVNRSNAQDAGWVVAGGALLVLNGTGAGQVRRIVSSNSPRGWTLDAPLGPITLSGFAEAPSFIQILPFRGENIFFRNHLADTGAFQFYGIGIHNLVSENVAERITGFFNWGQWRGWQPGAGDRFSRLGGLMGCGANPNMYNVVEGNTILEGNTVVNYNTPQGSNANFLDGYVFGSTSGGNGTHSQPGFGGLSMNTWLVFRNNTVLSNGGFLITDDSANVILERNTLEKSTLQICVTNTTRDVLLVNNSAGVSCSLGS